MEDMQVVSMRTKLLSLQLLIAFLFSKALVRCDIRDTTTNYFLLPTTCSYNKEDILYFVSGNLQYWGELLLTIQEKAIHIT